MRMLYAMAQAPFCFARCCGTAQPSLPRWPMLLCRAAACTPARRVQLRRGLYDEPIGRNGEEVHELVGERNITEQRNRFREAAAGVGIGADLVLHALHLFF